MKVIKIIFLIIMVLILTPTPTNSKPGFLEIKLVVAKRVSRFLQQNKSISNPRISGSCGKGNDGQVCGGYLFEGRNAICCNNKCTEAERDFNNCGACGKKCAFGEICCRGECVNARSDKRHCGFCNNICVGDGNCVYGVCDYAV
ncbi:hypothetical protein ABFS83_10G146300 [Erythranthe nasuta]